MTWMQVGVSAAVVTAALMAWFGIWSMADRRFTELRGAIDKANESNDAAHKELGTRIDGVRTELHGAIAELRRELRDVAGNVNVLVGRQQERDRAAGR